MTHDDLLAKLDLLRRQRAACYIDSETYEALRRAALAAYAVTCAASDAPVVAYTNDGGSYVSVV